MQLEAFESTGQWRARRIGRAAEVEEAARDQYLARITTDGEMVAVGGSCGHSIARVEEEHRGRTKNWFENRPPRRE
jgi:hypothetical protein